MTTLTNKNFVNYNEVERNNFYFHKLIIRITKYEFLNKLMPYLDSKTLQKERYMRNYLIYLNFYLKFFAFMLQCVFYRNLFIYTSICINVKLSLKKCFLVSGILYVVVLDCSVYINIISILISSFTLIDV